MLFFYQGMKKTMFDASIKEEILYRIDTLGPKTIAQWGKMNVRQGLRHMTFAFQNALGELPVAKRKGGTLKKKLMKFFLLNAPIPKAKAETLPEFNTVKLSIDPPDFAAEHHALKQYVEKFFHAKTFVPESAAGGRFSPEDWGRLMYNHTNHHLKQFGA